MSKRPAAPQGPQWRQCGRCSGTGRQTCSSCGGMGGHTQSRTRTGYDGRTEYYTERVPCGSCSGGQVNCSRCGGTGRVLE